MSWKEADADADGAVPRVDGAYRSTWADKDSMEKECNNLQKEAKHYLDAMRSE